MAKRLDPDVSAMVDDWVDSGQATIPPDGVALLYLLKSIPCKAGSGCARNCKNNPFCLKHLGEKKWTEPTDEKSRKARDKQLEVEHGMLQDGQKVGLRNLGATCYVNSLLQIWHHNPNLRREVFRWDPKMSPDDYSPNQKVMAQLQRVFAYLQGGKQPVYNPAPFVDALSLSHSIQQDGLEFCRLFMGIMESELQPCIGKQVGVIHSDYAGEYETGIRCCGCAKYSPRRSVFFELELCTKGQSRLEHCIGSYFASEELTESNKYDCDQCREKTGQKQDAQREVYTLALAAGPRPASYEHEDDEPRRFDHAGDEPRRFAAGKRGIVLETSSLGTGVSTSGATTAHVVRCPTTVEAITQLIGRGGRVRPDFF